MSNRLNTGIHIIESELANLKKIIANYELDFITANNTIASLNTALKFSEDKIDELENTISILQRQKGVGGDNVVTLKIVSNNDR